MKHVVIYGQSKDTFKYIYGDWKNIELLLLLTQKCIVNVSAQKRIIGVKLIAMLRLHININIRELRNCYLFDRKLYQHCLI